VCQSLCVIVTNEQEACDCEENATALPWDSEACEWSGTVTCGSLQIDLRVNVQHCDDGCYLCLTSSCLGLDGECSPSGPCMEFDPGHNSGECGTYLRDCSQQGGFDETWLNLNPVACTGDNDCTDITLRVICNPRVNPAGTGQTRTCKDCDCVCDCISINYQELIPFPPCGGIRLVCWDQNSSRWETTYTCSSGDQTITIELERGENGCCYWLVSVSKGLIDGQASQSYKTDCPGIELSLLVTLDDEDAVLLIDCYDCCLACPYCASCYEQNTGIAFQGTPTPDVDEECCFTDLSSFTLEQIAPCEWESCFDCEGSTGELCINLTLTPTAITLTATYLGLYDWTVIYRKDINEPYLCPGHCLPFLSQSGSSNPCEASSAPGGGMSGDWSGSWVQWGIGSCPE
jgi:hypothetical protein